MVVGKDCSPGSPGLYSNFVSREEQVKSDGYAVVLVQLIVELMSTHECSLG